MKTIGKGVMFHRIRRITGYLVGSTNRFNNAKQAEERDRIKHRVKAPPKTELEMLLGDEN